VSGNWLAFSGLPELSNKMWQSFAMASRDLLWVEHTNRKAELVTNDLNSQLQV
jgi:hypothetical protein